MVCDNHRDREGYNCSGWALRRFLCDECIEEYRKAAAAPRQPERWEEFYHPSMDMDTSGMPLHGRGSREAIHNRHQTAMKETDEQ